MMAEKRMVPEVRFAGFEGEWEERRFSDFIQPRKEKGNPEDFHVDVELENLVTDMGTLVGDLSIRTQSNSIFRKKDVLFGRLRPYLSKWWFADCDGVKSGEIWALMKTDLSESDFIYVAIQTGRFLESANISSGTKMPRADWSKVANDIMKIPGNAEQTLIGSFFLNLEKLIAAQQRKVDKLAVVKKAMLEKMFPKDGANVPEIRFAGFSGAWERCQLGELYTERNEKGNDSLPILSVSIHHGISNSELDEDDLGKHVHRSEDKSMYKHVFYGDLVFNMMRAWQGAVGVSETEGMVSPAYITAIPNKRLHPIFMDCYLRREEAIAQMNNLSYGVTDFRKRLYWNSFIKIVCWIPSPAEQEKIASYFRHLDRLTTLQTQKLTKLKTIKLALLAKMFV